MIGALLFFLVGDYTKPIIEPRGIYFCSKTFFQELLVVRSIQTNLETKYFENKKTFCIPHISPLDFGVLFIEYKLRQRTWIMGLCELNY